MTSNPQPNQHNLIMPVGIPFLAALQFLTICPPIIKRAFTPKELGNAVGYYPLVGFLLGAFLAGAHVLLLKFLPEAVSLALVLALWVLASGALHLDGFLDSCDGLWGGANPEERLRIMHDERIGAFALSGGVLLLLIKYVALSSTLYPLTVLLLAPTLGRWGIAVALAMFPYGREQGVGRDIKDHVTWRHAVMATIFTVFFIFLTGSWSGMLALFCAGVVGWVISRLALRVIPGLTGDIYGAINELIELAVLLVFCVRMG